VEPHCYKLVNFPAGQSRADVQQRTISVILKRVNALGVSEPEVRGAGNSNEPDHRRSCRGHRAAGAKDNRLGHQARLYQMVKDDKVTGGTIPGYKPQLTGLTGDDIASATPALIRRAESDGGQRELHLSRLRPLRKLTTANVAACSGDPSTTAAAARSAT